MSKPGTIDDLLAKQEIMEVLARYSRGIDRHDFALAKSAYHDDAYDEHGAARGNAHAVLDRIDAVLKSLEVSQHRVCNVLIELDGDTAHVESYFHSLHVERGADVEENVFGRYLDRFERRDDVWKIAFRRVVTDYASCRSKGEPYPLIDTFSRGARDRADPSYERN